MPRKVLILAEKIASNPLPKQTQTPYKQIDNNKIIHKTTFCDLWIEFLSVTGGVPPYLEQIRPELPAEQNISELGFTRGGLLVREFDEIFSDLFSRRSKSYKEVITCLADGPKGPMEICKELRKSRGGIRSEHLDDLVKAGVAIQIPTDVVFASFSNSGLPPQCGDS